jgi:putative aldouronate transport system substrate-binding protein
MKHLMKRILTAALALSMVTGLCTGCGGTTKNESASGDKQQEQNVEDMPVINVVIGTTGNTDDSDKVVKKINEILAEKVGAQIAITWISFGNFDQQLNLMLTSENELDIAYLWGSPASFVNNGQLLDLTDYWETASDELKELIGETYINACKFDDRLYWLPSMIDRAQEVNLSANRKMLEKMGVEVDDEKIWSWDEIHDLAAKAVENHPGIYGIVPENASKMVGRLNWDSLGDDYNIGVVEDRGSTGKVVSITDCQEFVDFAHMMHEWNEEGLIMPDILSNSEYVGTYISEDKAFGMLGSGACPNGMTDKNSTACSLTISNQWASASASLRMGYFINAKTKYPDESFKVLEQMYTDEDIKRLLSFGIEGENYILDSEGRATLPEGMTLQTDGYTTGFSNWYVLPNGQCDIVSYERTPDYWKLARSYDEEAETSGLLGCIFDNTNVYNEYSSCINVYNKYYEALLCGQVEDVDAALAAFKAEMKEAGEDKVIAEKQRQVDEFLSK